MRYPKFEWGEEDAPRIIKGVFAEGAVLADDVLLVEGYDGVDLEGLEITVVPTGERIYVIPGDGTGHGRFNLDTGEGTSFIKVSRGFYGTHKFRISKGDKFIATGVRNDTPQG